MAEIRPFSEVLAERLEKSGMSPWQLGVKCGVSEENLEAFLKGEKVPSGPQLTNMCNILGIEVEKTSLGQKQMNKMDFNALLSYIKRSFFTDEQKRQLIKALNE